MLRTAIATVLLATTAAGKPPVLSVPDIAERASSSVALITTTDAGGKVRATGSGVFLSADGLLVTNRHVVEGASGATAKLPTGAYYVVKGFVAVDKRNDLVLLQAEGSGFRPLQLATADTLRLGDTVVAIGSPLAFEGTVSTGIVSGFRSDLSMESAIQTTAPISPGSSGGALLDLHGKVVGITTLQATEGQNLNFAVPAKLVERLIHQPRKLQALADLRERINHGDFLTATPVIWKHTQDGSEWAISRVGDTIYAQMSLSQSMRDLGLHYSCQYEYDPDHDFWVGQCKGLFPVGCKTVPACEIEVFDSLTELTPERLTGLSPKLEDISCDDCSPKLSKGLFNFSLIRATAAPLANPSLTQQLASPTRTSPVTASVVGRIVSETQEATTFSWILTVTSSASLIADAEIQFLNSEGFAMTSANERGLRLQPGTNTFRGTSQLSAAVASKVVRLSAKLVAR